MTWKCCVLGGCLVTVHMAASKWQPKWQRQAWLACRPGLSPRFDAALYCLLCPACMSVPNLFLVLLCVASRGENIEGNFCSESNSMLSSDTRAKVDWAGNLKGRSHKRCILRVRFFVGSWLLEIIMKEIRLFLVSTSLTCLSVFLNLWWIRKSKYCET